MQAHFELSSACNYGYGQYPEDRERNMISDRNLKMDRTFDVIVVGAGYVGSSVAYHLCAAGLKTALFDQGPFAAGASRANFGNIQIQDMELTKSVDLINSARTCFANLEEELGRKVGLRQIGGLLPIENEAQWQMMAARLAVLQAAGIPSELVPAERLREVEPLIDPRGLLGGLYHAGEGQVDPFQLVWSYLRLARRKGLKEYYFTPVIGFDVQRDSIKGIVTPNGRYSSACVVLCTGPTTGQLGKLLGRDWDIHYILGQALATEPVDLVLHNHVASASFFEPADAGVKGTVRANFAMSQSPHGHLLIGEAMYEADHFDRAVPFQSLPAIASCVQRYFPTLRKLRVLRSWSAPVAHTSDSCPLLGPVAGLPGLYLAVAFRSTVIVTPLAGQIVADHILRGRTRINIDNFSPERNVAHAD
jgi:glycine/D-amino acid oxidase-like deaminating enzyme